MSERAELTPGNADLQPHSRHDSLGRSPAAVHPLLSTVSSRPAVVHQGWNKKSIFNTGEPNKNWVTARTERILILRNWKSNPASCGYMEKYLRLFSGALRAPVCIVFPPLGSQKGFLLPPAQPAEEEKRTPSSAGPAGRESRRDLFRWPAKNPAS